MNLHYSKVCAKWVIHRTIRPTVVCYWPPHASHTLGLKENDGSRILVVFLSISPLEKHSTRREKLVYTTEGRARTRTCTAVGLASKQRNSLSWLWILCTACVIYIFITVNQTNHEHSMPTSGALPRDCTHRAANRHSRTEHAAVFRHTYRLSDCSRHAAQVHNSLIRWQDAIK
jgi:hypothetical protein